MMFRHHVRMSCFCRANIKVSSTETGAIFGNIVYESSAYADRSVVVLNDIHIDIMDYISPASCPDVQFRSMWAEFEWENKVGGCTMHLSGQHRVQVRNAKCDSEVIWGLDLSICTVWTQPVTGKSMLNTTR